MTPRLRFVCALLLAFCAVAVGAPDDAETKVYPLFEEAGFWWAGIADICELVGAEVEGAGATYATDKGDGLVRVEFRLVLGAQGPLTVKVGEDEYKLEVGKVEVERNGEHELDFIHAPRQHELSACATLEDLATILDFELDEDEEGRPVIIKGDEEYHLVQGERKWPAPVLAPGDRMDVFRLDPEELEEHGDLVWEGPHGGLKVTIAPQAGGGLAEHNGMAYRRQGGVLFGPVAPGAFRAEGQSADLMYLSIVRPATDEAREATRLPGGGAP